MQSNTQNKGKVLGCFDFENYGGPYSARCLLLINGKRISARYDGEISSNWNAIKFNENKIFLINLRIGHYLDIKEVLNKNAHVHVSKINNLKESIYLTSSNIVDDPPNVELYGKITFINNNLVLIDNNEIIYTFEEQPDLHEGDIVLIQGHLTFDLGDDNDVMGDLCRHWKDYRRSLSQ